ncbi:MAG: YitT family protein [Clostridia bacterium]|nr:YitT family protein [Clostridia bacterium]
MEKKEKTPINLKPLNFLGLLIAGTINAIGVCLFLAPLNIYDGGLSGTSVLVGKFTPPFLPMSVFLIVLNFPFYIIGHKKIAKEFLIYSLFAIGVYSLAAFLINGVIFSDFFSNNPSISPVVGTDTVLGSLFGGLLSGVGSGLVMRFGGALDGVEVMALLFHKRLGITVGTFVMMYNAVLFVTAALIFQSWVLPLYSIVAYFIGLKTIDFIVEGLDKGKAALIITENAEALASALSEEFKRGITLIDAKGYYSGTDKEVLYIVVNRFEITKLKEIVSRLDKTAFVSIMEVSEILGASKMYRK